MKTKLKPCPWCGVVPKDPYFRAPFKVWYVCCENVRCRMTIYTTDYASKASAVKAWNRRKA